jgi:catechol 2,3-dioxygenase-like lactoylglutathione lyase family enzyme
MTENAGYHFQVAAPVFPVTDVKASHAYYTERLLFRTGFEWADSDDEPVRYLILINGDCELHLSAAREPRRTLAYFFVKGVAAYYDAVTAAGAEITEALGDQPWGMREFEAADPDGNRICFGESLQNIAKGGG